MIDKKEIDEVVKRFSKEMEKNNKNSLIWDDGFIIRQATEEDEVVVPNTKKMSKKKVEVAVNNWLAKGVIERDERWKKKLKELGI